MKNFLGLVVFPDGLKPESTCSDLHARLQWGMPDLTILDVRSRDQYDQNHIMGAVPMPMTWLLTEALNSLEFDRDLYVYGSSDEETRAAANQLRQAGYRKVAELKGGLTAWQAAKYPVEQYSFAKA